MAPGDTSGLEAIDFPGDIDEFTFSGVAGTEMNVLFQPVVGLKGEMHLEVLQAGRGVASGSVRGPTQSLDAAGTEPFRLPSTGEYTVRVRGEPYGSPAETTGRYRFELYRINRLPERAAISTPIGFSVVGEALDRPGDIDEYRIPAAPGRSFAVAFDILDSPKPALWLEVRQGENLVGAPASSERFNWAGWPSPIVGYTSMITAPDTGSYTLRVHAHGNTFGRYNFEIYPLSMAPESAPSRAVLGVPVTGERLERAMDVDTFTFDGTAGQDINVFLRRDPGFSGQLHLLFQRASAPRYEGSWGQDMSYVTSGSMTLDSAHAGRLTLPFTGSYKVYVDGYESSQTDDPGKGPYSFLIAPIDRRPEGRGAGFAIGETVRESIYPSGDIDEFTFQGLAGDQLTITLGGDQGVLNGGYEVWLLDSAGRNVTRTYVTSHISNVQLPASGTYTVRVWQPLQVGWTVFAGVAMGNYSLIVSRRN